VVVFGVRLTQARGQVSIEYLLVLVLMFSYMTIVIFPILDVSTGTATDVSNYSTTKFVADKLAAAADQLCTGANLSTRLLTIEVPSGAFVVYFDKDVNFDMNSALNGRGSDQNITIETCAQRDAGGNCIELRKVCNDLTKTCHGSVRTDCRFSNCPAPACAVNTPKKLVGGNKYVLKLKKVNDKIEVSD